MPGNALPDVIPVQLSYSSAEIEYRDEYSKSQHNHSPTTPSQNHSRQTPQWPTKARTTNACEAFHQPRQARSHGAIFSIHPQSLSRRYNTITWRSLPFQPCYSSANQIRSGLGSTRDTTITCVVLVRTHRSLAHRRAPLTYRTALSQNIIRKPFFLAEGFTIARHRSDIR